MFEKEILKFIHPSVKVAWPGLDVEALIKCDARITEEQFDIMWTKVEEADAKRNGRIT